jgi:hypothetical protein
MLAALALFFLPGSRRLQNEPADRFIPVPIYTSVSALFAACTVLWQMRRHPHPLPPPMAAQRHQAYAGLLLACLAVLIIYLYVHFHIAAPGKSAV